MGKVGGVCLPNVRFLQSSSDQDHEKLPRGQIHRSREQNRESRNALSQPHFDKLKHLSGEDLFGTRPVATRHQ